MSVRTRAHALARVANVAMVGIALVAAAAPAAHAAPAASLNSITPITNSQYQYVSGSAVFVNTNQSGSFRVSVDATEVTHVTFPDLDGAGASLWTPAGATDAASPFQLTYSWAANGISPGAKTATAFHAGGSISVPFTVTADNQVPTGSIDYLDGPNKNNSVAVTFSMADAISGIASWKVQRSVATYAFGLCGSYGVWGDIGVANQASPYADTTIASGSCYRYRLLATDRVGNTATITTSKEVKVDKVAPSGSLTGFTEVSGEDYLYAIGSVLYYNPIAVVQASVDVDVTDVVSGIQRVDYPALGPYGEAFASYSDPFGGQYTLPAGTSDSGGKVAVVRDAAGNVTNIPFSVEPDSNPPTGSSISYADVATQSTAASITFAAGSDPETGVARSVLERRDASYVDGVCGTYNSWQQIGGNNPTSPYADSSLQDNSCYQYRFLVYDNVNNAEIAVQAHTIKVDVSQLVYPVGYRHVANIPVTIDAGSYGGVDVASWRLERRQAVYAADACDSFGAWTQIGAGNPAGAVSDTSVSDAHCYEYRAVLVSSSAAETYIAGSGVVMLDTTAPTNTLATVGPVSGSSAPITGFATDDTSTLFNVTITYVGPSSASGTVCTNPIDLVNYACAWNTLGLPDGTYAVTANAQDRAGNSTSSIRNIVVDNTQPTASLGSFTPISGSQYQYVSSSTVFVNGNQDGSFAVNIVAADTVSGIASVSFPDLDGTAIVWTPSGGASDTVAPYSVTYAWTAGAASPGAKNATVTDGVGNARNVAFTVTTDSNVPLNGTVSYATGAGISGGITRNAALSVAFTVGTDGGSGVDTSRTQLQRSDASYASGVCGSFGSWNNVGGAGITSPYADSTVGGAHCYKYRVLVSDRVGNVATFSSASTIKVDRTVGTGTFNAAPTTTVTGTTTISGTAADGQSDLASVSIAYAGAASGSVCSAPSTPATWSCSWNTSALPDGQYTLSLTVVDVAGNSTIAATRTIDIDNDAPTISVTGFVEGTNVGAQSATGTTMYINPSQSGSFTVQAAASDGLGVAQVVFADPLLAHWAGGGTDATGPSPYSALYSWTAGAASASSVEVQAVDTVGNHSETSFDIVADATAPTVAVSQPTAVFDLDGTITPAWSGADAPGGAGQALFTIERAYAPITASVGDWEAWPEFTGTAAVSTSVNAAAAGTWCYRATAADAVGNVSAATTQRCTAVPQDDDIFTATGSWKRVSAPAAFGQDYRQASASGASLRTTISGKRVSLVVSRCKGCGVIDIFLGSTKLKNDVSLNASSTSRKQLIPVFAGTTTRAGVLKIVVQSAGDPVQIEGVAVSAT